MQGKYTIWILYLATLTTKKEAGTGKYSSPNQFYGISLPSISMWWPFGGMGETHTLLTSVRATKQEKRPHRVKKCSNLQKRRQRCLRSFDAWWCEKWLVNLLGGWILPADGCKWLYNNHGDRFRPLRIGLLDPFQMACLWLIHGGYWLLANWDDPPSGQPTPS